MQIVQSMRLRVQKGRFIFAVGGDIIDKKNGYLTVEIVVLFSNKRLQQVLKSNCQVKIRQV